jgi:hypothetical protein
MDHHSLLFQPIGSALEAREVFKMIESLAVQHNIKIKPAPSEPTSCCSRGCEGCVWRAFFEAAQFWRQSALELLNLNDS